MKYKHFIHWSIPLRSARLRPTSSGYGCTASALAPCASVAGCASVPVEACCGFSIAGGCAPARTATAWTGMMAGEYLPLPLCPTRVCVWAPGACHAVKTREHTPSRTTEGPWRTVWPPVAGLPTPSVYSSSLMARAPLCTRLPDARACVGACMVTTWSIHARVCAAAAAACVRRRRRRACGGGGGGTCPLDASLIATTRASWHSTHHMQKHDACDRPQQPQHETEAARNQSIRLSLVQR